MGLDINIERDENGETYTVKIRVDFSLVLFTLL